MQQRITVRRTIALGLSLVAIGALLLAFISKDSPYLLVALALVVLAFGSALATPSATTGIMGSLPMNKAGVGSAVNDTTREVGGAVGIAVIGSVLASVYRSRIGDATDLLPPGAAGPARDNVGSAVKVGHDVLGGDPSALERYLGIVGDAFTSGFNVGMGVAAAAALLGALAVLRWHPRSTAPPRQPRTRASRV